VPGAGLGSSPDTGNSPGQEGRDRSKEAFSMNVKSLLIRGAVVVSSAGLLGGLAAASASAATVPGTLTAVTHSAQHNDTTSGPVTGALLPSPNGPVWAIDNLTEKFTVVPVNGLLPDGANYQVTINVVGSFKGFADPGANGLATGNYGQLLTSTGPVKGTIEYDVYSATPPDPSSLLPNQAPDTGLGAALSQLFDGQTSLIVGGGNYNFSYQNGNYVQTTTGITGDVTGH
jgi:hypothetical protein